MTLMWLLWIALSLGTVGVLLALWMAVALWTFDPEPDPEPHQSAILDRLKRLV